MIATLNSQADVGETRRRIEALEIELAQMRVKQRNLTVAMDSRCKTLNRLRAQLVMNEPALALLARPCCG